MSNRVRVLIALAAAVTIATAGAALQGSGSATPTAESRVTWEQRMERVEAALASHDLRTGHEAVREAVRDAHATSLRTHAWAPLLQAGDAQQRVEQASGSAALGKERARVTYLAALFHAREARSVDGVLQAATALANLGDAEMVQHALVVARELVGRDPSARERVDRAATELRVRVAVR